MNIASSLDYHHARRIALLVACGGLVWLLVLLLLLLGGGAMDVGNATAADGQLLGPIRWRAGPLSLA